MNFSTQGHWKWYKALCIIRFLLYFFSQRCIWKCEFIGTSCQVAKGQQWDYILEGSFSSERCLHAGASRWSKNTSSWYYSSWSHGLQPWAGVSRVLCKLLALPFSPVPGSPAAFPGPLASALWAGTPWPCCLRCFTVSAPALAWPPKGSCDRKN